MKISVLIEALTGKFETDTARASKTFQREVKKMERQAAYFGRRLALALSPVALIAITKKSIDFASTLVDTADKLDIGVEALQEYRFAAEQSGVETSQFDKSLEILNRRIGETAQGFGEGKQAFDLLGVSITGMDGKIRPTEKILRDVADAMIQIESQATRAAVANQLFGRSGSGMLNVLAQGSAGLDDYARAARDLGLVMGEDLARKAEEAGDKIEALQKVLQVRIASAVAENADSIIALTDALIAFVVAIGKATQGWNDWLARQGVGVATLDEIRSRGDELLEDRRELEAELAAYESSRKIDPFDGYRNALRKQIEEIKAEQLELQTRAIALMKEAQGPLEPPPLPERLDPGRIPALANLPADPKLVKQRADEIAKIIQGLHDQVATFGMGDEAALIQLMDLSAGQEAINQASDLLGKLRALEMGEQQRAESAAERLALEQEYASLVESLMTPIERHVAEIERIAELYAAGIIPNVEEYAEAINRVTQRYDESNKKVAELDEFAKQAARNMQDTFADFLFDPWEDGLEGMLQGFSNTLRRMAAEAAAAAIFKKLFGDEGGAGGILSGIFGGASGEGGFGAFIGSLFGGAKARGGPIVAGRAYLVGEQGPEIVVPRASGQVVPNDQLGGMGGSVINNTFNLPPVYSRQSVMQLAQEAQRRQSRAAARNR